jgi:hypothetical protein
MKDKRNSVPVTLKKRLNRVLISDITFDMPCVAWPESSPLTHRLNRHCRSQ